MSYYTVLGLSKEPFSTSPDPDFFYHSSTHEAALKRLEIAIRLKRGLSIILGDVGMGKTTLSRELLRTFEDEEDTIFHLILDPNFKSEYHFLSHLVKAFALPADTSSTQDLKESLERYLFQTAAEENKTIVLLVDEGQKLSQENIEVLRMLLNFETNEFKLLQVVIMAQIELLPHIQSIRNFMDRIALKYTINPLDEEEMKKMIEFRLKKAGYGYPANLFTDDAIRAIFQCTQGYPRQVAMVCHDALETAVMKERLVVDADIANQVIHEREKYEK